MPSRLPNGNIKAEFSPLNRFTRANAGVYLVIDLAPFIARITDPSSGDSDTAKLDQAVAAMLAEKVFLVRPLVFFIIIPNIGSVSFNGAQKPTTLMADPTPTRFRLIFTQSRPTMEARPSSLFLAMDADSIRVARVAAHRAGVRRPDGALFRLMMYSEAPAMARLVPSSTRTLFKCEVEP
jgi:hypothetical protein